MRLTKNEEFVTSFMKKLKTFSFYKDELHKILKEAVKMKDRSVIVDSRLKFIFGDALPDVVLSVLAEHLTVEDLPLP